TAKLFLLRDHALPQVSLSVQVVAQTWHAVGAHVAPRRAELWLRRSAVAGPGAGPPSRDGAVAGIRDPGSNAGSSVAAGIGGHSLGASRAAVEVVAAA